MSLQDYLLAPVSNHDFISSLRELVNFLKSCVGPKGMSKLLVTSGNYIQLTSCSGTLVQRLDVQNPICRYILQAMKAQPDFGLYTGIFISSMLEQVWTLQNNDRLTTRHVINVVQHLTEGCQEVFISAAVALTVNFDSAMELVFIVKNVIFSKKFLLLPEKFADELCLTIVKAFLMSVDNNDFTIKNILINAEQGSNEIYCYSGIMYQIIDKEDQLSFEKIQKLNLRITRYYVLLFSTMLIFNEERDGNIVLNNTLGILQSAVESGIHVVACQKVVHDSIKLFLRRNSVILLERMGTQQTDAVKEMTNAVPISDLSKVFDGNIDDFKGCLTYIYVVKFNKKDYFVLQNDKKTVTTLAMCTASLARESEVKVSIDQALETLRSLARDSRLVPGAGCFEVWLLLHVQSLQVSKERKNKDDHLISSVFQKAIISASCLQLPVYYDTLYHHAWASEDQDRKKCNCGLITNTIIGNSKGSWILLDKYDANLPGQIQNASLIDFSLSDGVIMDSLALKRNALMSALEVSVNLLSIGSVVYKK